MTIAIGLIASDGLVLGVDSQESYGYMKAEAQKILIGMGGEREPRASLDDIITGIEIMPSRASQVIGDIEPGEFHHHMTVGVTGSGNGVYIDSASGQIRDIALKHKSNPDEAEKLFREKLVEFYGTHVIPFSTYPDSDRPDFDLLIAYGSNKFGDKLWRSHKNVLEEVHLCAAIGIGSFYAQNLLDKLYRYENLEFAKALAAFIVFQVKENVEGCGRNTRILTIKSGRAEYIGWESILEFEIEFRKFPRVENELFGLVFGGLEEKTVSGELRKQARKLRSRVSKITLSGGLP